ncbi:MAG: HAD family hydrolase [Sulfobacillus sp.]
MEIFGFSGKLGVGKNYIVEKLFLPMLPRKHTVVMAFSDHFKVDCCVRDRLAYERVFVQKDEESRALLQLRGTQQGRMTHGDDIWVQTLDIWLQVLHERGVQRAIVTDVRFPNEFSWIKSRGGKVFRIVAPERNHAKLSQESKGNPEVARKIAEHTSETALDHVSDEDFDYVIHNDPERQSEVPNAVRNIVRELRGHQRLVVFCDLDDTVCRCQMFYDHIVESVGEVLSRALKIEEPLRRFWNAVYRSAIDSQVHNYETRYYAHEDFAESLVQVYRNCLKQLQMPFEDPEISAQIRKLGMSVYDQGYPAIPGAIETVRELQKLGKVVIYSLGDHAEQMKKIAGLGLLDLDAEIFTHKDENMFRYLKSKYPADTYAMIGDSLSKDIVPAFRAGIRNLFYVSRKDRWSDLPAELEPTVVKVPQLGDELLQRIRKCAEQSAS